MIEKTQIEKIIDAIESKEELKLRGSEIVKENKKEDWNKEVEESPYNKYFGVDIKCALAMMDGLKKGLATKDAMYVSEHHFKVPAQRTRDLIYKYSEDGEAFYQESTNIEKRGYYKARVEIKQSNIKRLSLKK